MRKTKDRYQQRDTFLSSPTHDRRGGMDSFSLQFSSQMGATEGHAESRPRDLPYLARGLDVPTGHPSWALEAVKALWRSLSKTKLQRYDYRLQGVLVSAAGVRRREPPVSLLVVNSENQGCKVQSRSRLHGPDAMAEQKCAWVLKCNVESTAGWADLAGGSSGQGRSTSNSHSVPF